MNDEARIIPLHGGPAGSPLRRARRLAGKPATRAQAQPAASVHHLPLPTFARPPVRVPWAARAVDLLRERATGDYVVDEFGFDRQLTEHVVLPLAKLLYDEWFRVEVSGVDNLPFDGGALLVANHAGALLPFDALMTAVAVHAEHPRHRLLRMLGADLLFATPGLGVLARKAGATLACPADAYRLLAAGELVGAWPEGVPARGKPLRARYELQRFAHGGFVPMAIRAGVPVVPVSIVGAEEAQPVLGNARLLARLLDLPYFPITPTFPWLGPLGLVPLPSKWYIEFGAPIETTGIDPDGPAALELTDQVREAIQRALNRLRAQLSPKGDHQRDERCGV